MYLLYIILGLGFVFSVLVLVLRKKAPKISLFMQILVAVAFVCAIVWAILNVQPYNAFAEAMSSRYN